MKNQGMLKLLKILLSLTLIFVLVTFVGCSSNKPSEKTTDKNETNDS